MVGRLGPPNFQYEQVDVPPSDLLASILDCKENVQLYYREKIIEDEEVPSSGTKKLFTPIKRRDTCDSQTTDLDLTGSPLRADFDVNEEFDNSDGDLVLDKHCGQVRKQSYRGLDVKDARTLLSLSNIDNSLMDSRSWTLCTGEDKQRTVYLGAAKNGGNVVSLSKMTWSGPQTPRELSSSVKDLRVEHMNGGGSAGRRLQCRAEYPLTRDTVGTTLHLACTWEDSGYVLEKPPQDAVTTLHVTQVAGDEKLRCESIYKELEQLKSLVQGLTGARLVWSGRPDSVALEDELSEVIEAAKKPGSKSLAAIDSEADISLNIMQCQRQDLDFTDMLWTVLSRANSYAELTEALQQVFNSIIRDKIRPFLYSGHVSDVVNTIRDLVRNGGTVDLSGVKPLLMLIEMGAMKLKRDYSHALLSGGLVFQEALAPFLTWDSWEECVRKLEGLHSAIELAVACQTYLTLPQSQITSVMVAALANLSEVGHNNCPREYSLVTSHIYDQLGGCYPSMWQARIGAGDRVEHVFHAQVDVPEELLSVQMQGKSENPDNEESLSEPSYYFFTLSHHNIM